MADDDLEKRLSDLTQGIGDCEEPEKEPPKQVGYEEFLPKSDDSTFKMPDLSKPLFPIDDTVTSRSLSGITFPISSSPKKSTSTFDHEAFRKQMERMNTKEEEIIKKGDIRIILESYNGYPTERYRLFAEVGGERTQLYEHQYFQRLNLMKTEKFKEKTESKKNQYMHHFLLIEKDLHLKSFQIKTRQ